MSFMFDAARRRARLHATASVTLLLLILACQGEEGTEPAADPIPQGPSATTPEPPAATTPEQPAATTPASSVDPVASNEAAGIPFGDFHLPASEFGNATYSGSLQALWPTGAYQVLEAAQAKGARVVISLAGSRTTYTNPDGTLNLRKWKSQVSRFKGFDLPRFVSNGTVIGHYLVDEPFCTSCWGGRSILAGTLEEMARYSKSLWPTMPTVVRSYPSLMPLQGYDNIDFAWAQWGGPLHKPSFQMTPEQFRDREVAAAQERGLGLVFGLNYLDGGDGSSGVNGTYAKDPKLLDKVTCVTPGSCYRYAMSVSEVERIGTLLAAAPYACAMINWKYDASFIARPGMREALDSVATVARTRPRTSCVP